MRKQVIISGGGAPYSEVVRYGNLLFVSGQVSEDKLTGETIHADIATQTTNTLNNLKTLLEEAGSSMDQVIKITIYLSKAELFADMNAAYRKFFSEEAGFPARICTYGAELYDGLDVEIECIAGIED